MEFINDKDRESRIGIPEAIYGEYKTAVQIISILNEFITQKKNVLITRVQSYKSNEIKKSIPSIKYHEKASCITFGHTSEIKKELGHVTIITGGTSDIGVAEETKLALNFHNIEANIICDIGVAGLHRLLDKLEEIKSADVVIVCAGMEGSLPTVLAGLISKPIIGLPVSVGYGVSKYGESSLNSMLSSCSPGLVVVNIDNGYGAAMAAVRILMSKI